MTRQGSRAGHHMGALKTLLIAGSIAATLAGTRLLAGNDNGTAQTAAGVDTTVIVIERGPATALNLPPRSGSEAIVLELAPVPQAIKPQIGQVQAQQVRPVARARTS